MGLHTASTVILAGLLSGANASTSLDPSGPWNIDYRQSLCLLSRPFGTGEKKVTLGFRPAPLGNDFRVVLLVPSRSKRTSWGQAKLYLGDGASIEAPFARGPVTIEGFNIVAIDATREKVEGLGEAKSLSIIASDLNVEVKLVNMAAAMKALDTCEKDLLVSWGMDRAVVASLASYPMLPGGMPSIFNVDDYPHAALLKGEQGPSWVRLRIGKDGKVNECAVVESSGSKALDAQTCRVIAARARFIPARTKSGEAVDSVAVQRIRWEIAQ